MGKVFKFEFLTSIKKKSFIISVSIMFVLTLLISAGPKIFNMIQGIGSDEKSKVAYLTDIAQVKGVLEMESEDFEFVPYTSREQLEKDIKSGDIYAGVLAQNGERKVLVKNSSLTGQNDLYGLARSLSVAESTYELQKAGLEANQIQEAMNVDKYELINLEKDGAKSYWLVYISTMIMYFFLLTFGSQVAMAVAREKSDRTMEILITSTSPKNLIRGKVYANACVGILTMLILGLGLYISNQFGGEQIQPYMDKLGASSLNMNQIIITFAYFVLGIIMYLFLFASAASLVSKVEDVNYAIQPITLVFIVGFFIALFGAQNPGIALKIGSYFPLTSPLAMIARYGVEAVSEMEVLISFAILVVTTILVRMLAVKIYKMGSLHYGKKVNFFKSIVKVFKKN